MVLGKYWETDEVELEAHRSAVVLAIKEGIDPADLKPAFWKGECGEGSCVAVLGRERRYKYTFTQSERDTSGGKKVDIEL